VAIDREFMSASRARHAPSRPSRAHARFAVILMALVAMLTLIPADAAPKKTDAKTQRDEVRKQKVQVASQLDKLNATDDELQDALDVLDANLRIEEAALENAQAEVDRATGEAAEIQQQQAATQAELERMEQQVKDVAVAAYAKPPLEDDLLSLDSSDLNEAVRKQALLGIVNSNNLDITEQIKGKKAELSDLEQERLDALARAEAARSEVQGRHDEVAQAQAQQQVAVDALDARIDRLLNEAASLESQDKALSKQMEEDARKAAEAAAKARRSKTSTGSGPSGPVSLTSVRGITVATSIAGKLEALLNDADGDGIHLGGSGYRDSSAQVALRRAHCGSSNYDIYDKPAFQCSPPTARPGTSNHERGLAIDFTAGGAILTRGSAGFRWLQSNAGKYGFKNLPSEPWHWSVDGN
jgi:peptidoglycan hydrolase CwlO-like protein